MNLISYLIIYHLIFLMIVSNLFLSCLILMIYFFQFLISFSLLQYQCQQLTNLNLVFPYLLGLHLLKISNSLLILINPFSLPLYSLKRIVVTHSLNYLDLRLLLVYLDCCNLFYFQNLNYSLFDARRNFEKIINLIMKQVQ